MNAPSVVQSAADLASGSTRNSAPLCVTLVVNVFASFKVLLLLFLFRVYCVVDGALHVQTSAACYYDSATITSPWTTYLPCTLTVAEFKAAGAPAEGICPRRRLPPATCRSLRYPRWRQPCTTFRPCRRTRRDGGIYALESESEYSFRRAQQVVVDDEEEVHGGRRRDRRLASTTTIGGRGRTPIGRRVGGPRLPPSDSKLAGPLEGFSRTKVSLDELMIEWMVELCAEGYNLQTPATS